MEAGLVVARQSSCYTVTKRVCRPSVAVRAQPQPHQLPYLPRHGTLKPSPGPRRSEAGRRSRESRGHTIVRPSVRPWPRYYVPVRLIMMKTTTMHFYDQ